MREMMNNFNQMSLQTGGNGVNPLIQAQMMNELKYRRLYEEERLRNENLERKMTSLIDRIERHTENNMKIKAKYSKEIENLRYQRNMLEQENEELQMNQQRGGEGMQREIEMLMTQKRELEGKVQMMEGEMGMLRGRLDEESQKQRGNPEREREMAQQIESMKMQLQRNEEELKVARGLAEEERQKGGRERSELEVERHKMELNIEHWKGQCDQMNREIGGLREMLDYEKSAKMRLEDRVRDLESRSFGGWNGGGGGGGGNYQSNSGVKDDRNTVNSRREQPNPNRNYPPMGNNYNSRNFQNQNQNSYNQFQRRDNQFGNQATPQKKEEVVFGRPTRNSRRGVSPPMNRSPSNKRSNSPFAVNKNLDIYGDKSRRNENPSGFGNNQGGNMDRSNYGRSNNNGPSPMGMRNNDVQGGFDRNSKMDRGQDTPSQWGSARPWQNNMNPPAESQVSGGLDSIASKRMAVRRGRGTLRSINSSRYKEFY
jgi:hypothetical protein